MESRLRRLLKSGRVRGVCFATPCTSFSLARNRTNDIRSRDHPWGNPRPRHPISEHDRESLRIGNKLMRLTIRLIHLCDECKIPWCFENPATSRCFLTREWQRILSWPSVHEVVMDQCSCGTKWKKPTRLIFGHVDAQDVSVFDNSRCNGQGVCIYTKCPHIQLTGSSPSGVPWTRIAQEYPRKLCDRIARILSNPSRSRRT